MWKPVFFFLFFCLCCSWLPAEPQKYYLVTDQELQTFETAKSNWETSKQTWLKQVQELSQEVKNLTLKSEQLQKQLQTSMETSRQQLQKSTILSSQLEAERATTTKLLRQFNVYEAESSQKLSSLGSELSSQRVANKELDGALSWWRLLAIAMMVGLGLVIVGGVIIKFVLKSK